MVPAPANHSGTLLFRARQLAAKRGRTEARSPVSWPVLRCTERCTYVDTIIGNEKKLPECTVSRADCCGNFPPLGNRPFLAAFVDAADGIAHALQNQPNFRIQLAIALVAVIGASLLHFDTQSWVIITILIGLVLAAELFNTCLEHVIDLIQPETHPLARSAKHAGAAAVLVASITAAVVGAIVYGQALAHLFRERS